MKVLAISDEDTNIMFQLIGIDTHVLKSRNQDELEKEFEQILQDSELGVVILNEKYLIRNRDFFKKFRPPSSSFFF